MLQKNYLVFKLHDQKFAISSQCVLNIIENVKLLNRSEESEYFVGIFCFNGMPIPLVDLYTLLDLPQLNKHKNKCVLIVELNFNNHSEIVGLSIDEVLEVTGFNDLHLYPCTPAYNFPKVDLRESVILFKNDAVVTINANRLHSSKTLECGGKQTVQAFSN